MTENDFLTYQKFTQITNAMALIELFKENNIEYVFEDTSSNFDPSFANNENNNEFRVKLKKQNFEKADQLLLTISESQINELDKDYYLYDFTDEELLEVLTKSEEWGKLDYLLAQKILKERGQEVNQKFLETLRKHRLSELAKPDENQKVWINAGYTFAFLGGLLGIFIGWHLLSHKKTLFNGDSVYGYSDKIRKHGYRIRLIGIICFVFYTILNMLSIFNL